MKLYNNITAFYQNNRKILTQVFRITVSAVLLIWVLNSIDWVIFFDSLKEYTFGVAIICFILFCANFVINSLKLKVLLAEYTIYQSLGKLISLHWSSIFLSNFLPTSFGGDVYKYYILQKNSTSKGEEIFSSLLMSRVAGFVAMTMLNLILAICVSLTNSVLLPSFSPLWWLEIALFTGLIILFTLWKQQDFFGNLFSRILPRVKILDRLFSILKKINILSTITLLKIFLLSLLYGLISCIAFAIYYFGAGVNSNFVSLFFVASLIFLSGILPITLNGLGLNEFIQVVLLQELMISSETAVFVAFVSRVFTLLYSIPGGIIFLFGNHADVREKNIEIVYEKGEE